VGGKVKFCRSILTRELGEISLVQGEERSRFFEGELVALRIGSRIY